jgi:hybrid cluster-associated redox disulfide protein
MDQITKEMTIMEVVNQFPQTIKVFYSHGLFCIGCHAAYRETVEQGALVHGLDVSQLMIKLNEAAAVKETEPAEKK